MGRKGGGMMPMSRGVPVPPEVASRQRANLVASRVSRRKILARTAAARQQIDAIAAGADLSDVADLPVITGLTPPRQKPKRAPAARAALADPDFLNRMQAPAKPVRVRPGDKATSALTP